MHFLLDGGEKTKHRIIKEALKYDASLIKESTAITNESVSVRKTEEMREVIKKRRREIL